MPKENRVLKGLVVVLWCLLPVPLGVLLILPAASPPAALGLGLGAAGFMWLAGQLLLAARPNWLNDALGTKTLWSFHGLMAVVSWVTIFFHRIQMDLSGLHGDPWQNRAGTLAWLGYFGIIGVALVFMAPGPWTKWPPVKGLRGWFARSWGLTYPRLRLFHRLTLVLTLLVVVHVLWAGPMAPDKNPGAFIVAVVWAAVCFGAYLWSKRPRGR